MSDTPATTTRRQSTIDHTANHVEIEGVAYSAHGMPEPVKNALILHGLRHVLLPAKDPAATHAALKAGKMPGREPKVEKKTPNDVWREAAANVHAEARVKADGVRPSPGKKLRDTPEFQAAQRQFLAAAANLTREDMVKVKANPLVMAEHAKLAGVTHDLASLFATSAPAAEPAGEATDEGMQEAA